MYKIFLLLAFLHFRSQAQSERHINFTFLVNGEILLSAGSPKLFTIRKDGKKDYYDMNIIPGELLIHQDDLNKISAGEDSIFISFDSYEYKGKTLEMFTYTVRVYKENFKFSYVIYKIYNLNRKEYRKIIPLHRGDQYEYEVSVPGSAGILIRRK
jgi:hypothetical protein